MTFNQVVADAGLGRDVTPHILRHTAATWMLQNGTDVAERHAAPRGGRIPRHESKGA
jgi:integrase